MNYLTNYVKYGYLRTHDWLSHQMKE
jgi:hypothetical protein